MPGALPCVEPVNLEHCRNLSPPSPFPGSPGPQSCLLGRPKRKDSRRVNKLSRPRNKGNCLSLLSALVPAHTPILSLCPEFCLLISCLWAARPQSLITAGGAENFNDPQTFSSHCRELRGLTDPPQEQLGPRGTYSTQTQSQTLG